MLSLEKIREDLREIRYYYSRKDKFDEAFKLMPSSVIDIVEKARKYNEAAKVAPVRLCEFDLELGNTGTNIMPDTTQTPEQIPDNDDWWNNLQKFFKSVAKFFSTIGKFIVKYWQWFLVIGVIILVCIICTICAPAFVLVRFVIGCIKNFFAKIGSLFSKNK